MQKKIHNSIHQYGEQITQYYNEIPQQFDPYIIHKFRITFKKLRALLRWLHTGKSVMSNSFEKIYHIAGELRNTQTVVQKLADEKIKLPRFKHWLNLSISPFKKQWNKLYQPKTIQQLPKKLADVSNQRYKNNKKFISKKIKKIQQILRSPLLADNALHEVRKKVKDIQYVLTLYKKWDKKISKKHNALFLHHLKTTAKQIGDYNDTRIALTLLKNYLEQEKDAQAIKLVVSTKRLWEAQKIRQKKEIIELMGYYKKLSF